MIAEPTPEFVLVHVDFADHRGEVLLEPEPAPPPASRKAAAIEIELPDGIRVRVGEEIGLAALRRVLAALRG